MKKIEKLSLMAILLGLSLITRAQNTPQGVSIAPDQVPPSKNAMLDVVAAEKGMLVPRVDKSVIEAGGTMAPPNMIAGEDGMLVFVTNSGADYGYWYFDMDPAPGEWKQFGQGSGSLWNENTMVTGNIYYDDGVTSGSVLINGNPDPSSTPSLGVYPLQIHTIYDQPAVPDNPAPGSLTFGGMATTLGGTVTTGHGNEINFNGSSLDLQFWNGMPVHIGSSVTSANLEVYGDIISNGGSIISDSTLKRNIQLTGNTITPGQMRENFKGLKTYSYCYKSDPHDTRHYGVLAQEVQSIFPQAVKVYDQTIGKDPNGKNLTQQVLTVDYNALSVFSLEVVKELVIENEAQDARISTLEEQVQSLLERVSALEQ